jgi:hypothetical protein
MYQPGISNFTISEAPGAKRRPGSSLQICTKSWIDGNPSSRYTRLTLNACHWLPRSFSLFEEKIFADGTDVRLNVGSWCRFPETGLFPSEDARLVQCGPEGVGFN